MSDEPFMGEIQAMSFNYPPPGWAMCNGQLLPIAQNQALFSLLGTTYGGNGQTNFALPDLRGRVPIHVGNGHTLGERGGEQAHTLTISELPQHTHAAQAAAVPATTATPDSTALLAQSTASQLYSAPANLTAMAPTMVGNTGGSQAHQNMAPFLTITYCIALQGVFPSQA
jgi:microcystin-dependent protein